MTETKALDQGWISDHAIERIRKRLGINKKAAAREAQRALKGAPIDHFSGRFRRHLDHIRKLHGDGADYRVTASAIFAFQYGNLATVFQVPQAHRKSARIQVDKWKEQET